MLFRSIVKAAREMLYDQDMPKFLWAEACNTTVYVHNSIPHNALGKITPESVFTGSKPEVSHFRIFGSTTNCHAPNERRKKMDMIAEKGYLVGYNENAKAYCIYILESRKFVVWRDVKFMEERAFRRSQEMPSTTQSEEDPLVQPQRLAEGNTSASPTHGYPRDTSTEDLQEGDQVDPPTTSGRTRRELRQIPRDAEDLSEPP